MKRLLNIFYLSALAAAFGSCEVDRAPIVIFPDPVIDNSGMTIFHTSTIYQSDVYEVVMTRTKGLSKVAEFDIMIDESILDEYNELNGSDYNMMPSSLYSVSATDIAFGEKEKTATFTITVNPVQILSQAGSVSAAEKLVIPFVCIPKSVITSPENRLNSLVVFSFAEPSITVEAPMAPVGLTFISGVAVPRSVELLCLANFRTLQPSKVSLASTQQMVDDFNAANGTGHLLLPASCYSISSGVFNSEDLELKYGITIEASGLSIDDTYLLPVKVASAEYTVVQDNIYYVLAGVQEIKYTVLNTDRYQAATKLAHKVAIEVRLNGALPDDIPIEFSYDASLIAGYNTAKGKSYEELDALRISVANGVMPKGTLNATVDVTLDMTSIAFEEGKEYVLPFVLDQTKLPQGSQVTSDDVVYVRLKRTLYGAWSNANNDGYVTGTSGWTSNNYMKASTTYNNDYLQEKYLYCNNYYSWDHGFHWYVAWDEVYNGEPDKRIVHAYSSVVDGVSRPDMIAWVVDNGSYFDMDEGKVWFNFQYYYNEDNKNTDTRQTIKCYLESPLTPGEF